MVPTMASNRLWYWDSVMVRLSRSLAWKVVSRPLQPSAASAAVSIAPVRASSVQSPPSALAPVASTEAATSAPPSACDSACIAAWPRSSWPKSQP